MTDCVATVAYLELRSYLLLPLIIILYGSFAIRTECRFWRVLVRHLLWLTVCFGAWYFIAYYAFEEYFYFIPGYGLSLTIALVVAAIRLLFPVAMAFDWAATLRHGNK
jgi:hypothetical protein